ncbi:hypothetical protein GF354_06115 [Candidatus Peregrinibacteria bacterium]|nr:hypothetical protein [Candidatus Peregrinibacteria bacterium]
MNKLIAHIQIFIIIFLGIAGTTFAVTTDELLPPASDIQHSPKTQYEEVEALKDLPDVTIEQTATSVVKTILELSMALSIIALVVAGVYYLMFEANDDKLQAAKSTILYLIIGMAIISAAYAIVTGLIQFDFF